MQSTHKKNLHSYGIRVTGQPDEPKKVTLTATVKRYDLNSSGTEVGKIDYTATIGAPIRVDTTAAVTAPKITPAKNNDIFLRVPLTGAEYITGIDASKITVKGNTNTSQGEVSITSSSITDGGRCTTNSSGLFVPVTASCGAMEMRLAPTSSGSGPAEPVHGIGKITITIQPEALMVNEESGWYVPDGDLTYDAVVWGCNPAVTITIQGATNKDSAYRNVSVQIEYAFKNFIGAIAFATENSFEGAIAAELKVRFNAGDWETDKSGQDLITCTKENVALDPNKTYYIWYNFNGNNSNDLLTTPGDWMNTNQTIQPTSETP